MNGKTKNLLAVLLVGVLGFGAVSCGDEGKEQVDLDSQTEQGGLVITPEFAITGVEDIADDVFLQELYLGVGQIELEPLDHAQDVVYVTREPVFLLFNVAEGELQVAGDQITLPHAGAYKVSIRLEPVDVNNHDLSHLTGTSMQVNGLVAQFNAPDGRGFVASGEPTPLPLRESAESRVGGPVQWVPWTYRSQRSALVQLDEVRFDSLDEQRLVITFDLRSWLTDAIAPITQAVIEGSAGEELEQGNDQQQDIGNRVDVSDNVDGRGTGIEELTGSIHAQSL
jgi:hypothetical protein